jgi:hypothetical protein
MVVGGVAVVAHYSRSSSHTFAVSVPPARDDDL